MDDQLGRFVRTALERGLAKEEIRKALLAARWPEDEVRGALDAYADVDFPLPVPRPKPYLPAREAFLYLVLFTLLYLGAWNLGALLFDFIDRFFPDVARHPEANLSGVRWAVATLLITYPGYLWLARRSRVAAREDPDRRRSRVRKWLTYLTLFLAAATLLGDLITLLFSLLEGELTTRFVLKLLTVGAIAGTVFGYYLWELRQDDLEPATGRRSPPRLRLFARLVSLAVAAAVVTGLWVAGSPGGARQAQLDERRVQALVAISSSIDRYWRAFDTLPPSLQTLADTRGYAIDPFDPQSGEFYDYLITGDRRYQLCARFDRPSPADAEPRRPAPLSRADSGFWRHGAGRTCFEIEARDDS